MRDIFGGDDAMQWVQLGLALVAAVGLIAGLVGLETGTLHREPVRAAHLKAGTRATAARSPRPRGSAAAHRVAFPGEGRERGD